MIAFIFIKESVLKLFEIREAYPFSNDPTRYADDFISNSSKCYRCVNRADPLGVGNHSTLNEQECNKMGVDFEFVKECNYAPDIFFFSVVLYLLTFSLAMTFRFFRTSRFFPSIVCQITNYLSLSLSLAYLCSLFFFYIDPLQN